MALFHSFYGWVVFHCVYVYVWLHTHTYTRHIFCIHSSVNEHSCCFCVLAIVSSATMNTGMHLFKLEFFSQIYAHQWDCWIIQQPHFKFLRETPYCFHSGCTSLHSHQHCRRTSFPPWTLQNLFVDVLVMPFWLMWIDTSL